MKVRLGIDLGLERLCGVYPENARPPLISSGPPIAVWKRNDQPRECRYGGRLTCEKLGIVDRWFPSWAAARAYLEAVL